MHAGSNRLHRLPDLTRVDRSDIQACGDAAQCAVDRVASCCSCSLTKSICWCCSIRASCLSCANPSSATTTVAGHAFHVRLVLRLCFDYKFTPQRKTLLCTILLADIPLLVGALRSTLHATCCFLLALLPDMCRIRCVGLHDTVRIASTTYQIVDFASMQRTSSTVAPTILHLANLQLAIPAGLPTLNCGPRMIHQS